MVRLFVILFALFLSGCGLLQQENTMKEYDVTIPVTEAVVPSESGITERPELLSPLVQPENEDFVRVKDYIPEIYTELKYAGEDNFTGQKIYGFDDIFLRYGTVMKLKAVSDEVNQQGYYLKLWDGFRPVSAQYKLWEICPDPEYVANPNKGYSNHSRGFAVDLTLVDRQGREVVMPTGFDDFSSQADRDYSDCPEDAAENARFLQEIMEKHGFQPEEILVVDDMQLACQMADPLGVKVCYAGWDDMGVPQQRADMEARCAFACNSVEEFEKFLFD